MVLYFGYKIRTKKGIMTKKIIKIITLFIIPFLFYIPVSNGAEIIANSSLFQGTISKRELRSIFSLRLKQWRTGERIIVVTYSDATSVGKTFHANFCKDALGVFPHQLQQAWDRSIYSGTGVPPKKVDTLEQMLDFIAKTKGAIGYVDGGIVDVDAVDGVKIINVD
ncbi:MAG: hypothetical protein D6B28_02655 [Gammaproteobacteria bacterium]|nr:MAG: hypothetical protein D6B28_02655 [Gammaproteobacteria bacterium]